LERKFEVPGKNIRPAQVVEIVSMRAAGFTVAAISERTGVSQRTIARILKRHGTAKGSVREELVEAAKRELIQGITSETEPTIEALSRVVGAPFSKIDLLADRHGRIRR
jgi:hypothetical protein